MSWTAPYLRVRTVDKDGVESWALSASTATVNLSGTLRLFGLDSAHLPGTWSALMNPAPTVSPWRDPYPIDGRIMFVDSVDVRGTPRFGVLDSVYTGSPPLRQTVVPRLRNAVTDWPYITVVYGTWTDNPDDCVTDVGWEADRIYSKGDVAIRHIRDRKANMKVTYKDPCVVKMPDGSWLMLLARTRNCVDDVGSGELGANQCLSDIVAWWAEADDPGFEDWTKVTGPYFIAGGLGTFAPLPEAEGVQFWLGTPGGAILPGSRLAVYYVVERTNYKMACAYDNVADFNTVFGDLAQYDRTSASSFQCCLGAKVIDLGDLHRMRADGRYGNEAEWGLSTTPTDFLVPGERGFLYIWRDEGPGLLLDIVNEIEPVGPVNIDYRKLGAPVCAVCSPLEAAIGDIDQLRLFFAAVNRQDSMLDPTLYDQTRMGLWLAHALDDGAYPVLRRDGAGELTRAGFDFLVGPDPFLPNEQTGADATYYTGYFDPDPVLLSTGRWRVGCGASSFAPDGTGKQIRTDIGLSEVSGDHADACDPIVAEMAAAEPMALRQPPVDDDAPTLASVVQSLHDRQDGDV